MAPPAAAAFSPPDLGGLKIWLKADGLTGLSDNDPVSTYTDFSGQGHNFAQITTFRPLYKVGIQNGLPGVLWDGADDLMEGGDLSLVFPTAATLFIVFQPTGGDNAYTLFRSNGNGDTTQWTDNTGYWGTFRQTRISNYPAAAPGTSGTKLICVKSDSSAYTAYYRGVSQGAQAASYPSSWAGNWLLGRGDDAGTLLTGYIFELCAYDTALSDTNRGKVDTYLINKWAIP
jgi:hypothetical protein